MAKQKRHILKGYFETGDVPTQAQYVDLIDSNLNLSDTETQTIIGPLTVNGAFTASFLNTGQGNNELFAMNQDVTTVSNVRFNEITASALLSASADIITRNLTASSNISASGDLTAANLTLSGDITSVGDDVTIVDALTVGGNITASSNVSASGEFIGASLNVTNITGSAITGIQTASFGEIHASDISASGRFVTPVTIGNRSGDFGNGELALKASSFGFNTKLTFNQAGLDVYTVGTTLASSAQGGSQNFYIISGSTTTPSANTDHKLVLFATGSNCNVGIATKEPTEKLTVHGNLLLSGSGLGHITASGNVSSSFTSTASFGSAMLTNLPTVDPLVTGALWVSGSGGGAATGSKYLMVFTG